MDLVEFLKILGLENSFTADTLKKAYDNYCSNYRPILFLNDLRSEFHSKESLDEMKSVFDRLMSVISQNEQDKLGGSKTIEEVSQKNLRARIFGSIGLTMVYIKPGAFIMGTPKTGSGVFISGEEQHVVNLTKAFYLSEVPITQFQWHKVMGTHLRDLHGKEYFSGPGHPAYFVSWHDCQNFLEKLNEIEKSTKYRLPTEAEWEYACRAGSFSKFYYGDDDSYLGLYAWYGGIERLQRPREVRLLKPNRWGLYDMLGNVWEWCQDWTHQAGDLPVDSIDPSGPSSGGFKVLRGGNWQNEQSDYLRCAARNFDDPRKRNSIYGFRIAMDI
jgi:formylglycine-generating enzyme required for sulfatase activity